MTIGVIVVIEALNEQEECTLCSYYRSFLCVGQRSQANFPSRHSCKGDKVDGIPSDE
jgi:hypothetical protein